RVNGRTAGARGPQLFEHERACALAHHEARAGRVERAGRMRWMLLLRSETAHRAEPGEDQGMHTTLSSAREHHVRVAALDDLGSFSDGVRARRARGDRCVVRPLDAERDRDLAARSVDEDAGDEARRNTVRPALAEDVALLDDAGQSPDRGAEDD